ncbi:hypothetical protein CRH09_29630 [Nocardia terpenica]|uniref:Uncharacterized protein n=1 Tax=Nocardia terpenica TaxID=455432 RepID=A0A291RQG1_9NOCA|nr:hypothetical protein CRH09_29630 [Nocardia terpenica]
MSTTCPACSWPSPMLVSSHGSVRYLRCVCGKWLVAHRGGISLVAGRAKCVETPAVEHLELIPLPEERNS